MIDWRTCWKAISYSTEQFIRPVWTKYDCRARVELPGRAILAWVSRSLKQALENMTFNIITALVVYQQSFFYLKVKPARTSSWKLEFASRPTLVFAHCLTHRSTLFWRKASISSSFLKPPFSLSRLLLGPADYKDYKRRLRRTWGLVQALGRLQSCPGNL